VIVIHSDDYLFKHGAYGVYVLRKLLQIKASHWCFYAQMDFRALQDWMRLWFRQGPYVMSDMTAQDQSMTGWAVHVLANFMKWLNLPTTFVDEFVRDKMEKSIGGKTVRTMTSSGEIWTYLINTIGTAARECFMYRLPYGLPMANGGDDTMRCGDLTLDSVYLDEFSSFDPCVDKRYSSVVGDFVTFRYHQGVLVKDPVILLRRLLCKMSIGDLENCAKGYFDLWAWNYSQGDRLNDVLSGEEIEAHSITTRIFMNASKNGISRYLPSNAFNQIASLRSGHEAIDFRTPEVMVNINHDGSSESRRAVLDEGPPDGTECAGYGGSYRHSGEDPGGIWDPGAE
jgi:hypothetical protein